jgi:hypothetical protein
MYDGIRNTKSAEMAINEDSNPIMFSNAKHIRYLRSIIE